MLISFLSILKIFDSYLYNWIYSDYDIIIFNKLNFLKFVVNLKLRQIKIKIDLLKIREDLKIESILWNIFLKIKLKLII